jgi:hypothetical protein
MASSIRCPNCRAEIPLSDVIEHQVDEELAARTARELAVREEELRGEFEHERARREAQVEKRAEERVATKLADLVARVEEQDEQIRVSRQRELEWLERKRKLEQKEAGVELEIARRVDEARTEIASDARTRAAEEHQLELRKKDLELEQVKRQIKELQESAEQTRGGLVGEAQEREIEDVLREKFRMDAIEPVKSGIRGADVLQRVYSSRGQCCGTILWESKHARNWSNGWIAKLKQDQAAAGADVAVLACSTLPSDVRHMDVVDGVWVVGFGYVAAMASALRQGLIGIAYAKSVDANRNNALHEIYDYLTSNDFNLRVRAMVEAFVTMKADLDSERRSMERVWTKRAKQLDALALNTAAMYGELEALIGTPLPPIETLELPAPVPLRSAG